MKPTDLIKDVFPGAVVGGYKLAKDGPMSESEIREAEDRGFAMLEKLETLEFQGPTGIGWKKLEKTGKNWKSAGIPAQAKLVK